MSAPQPCEDMKISIWYLTYLEQPVIEDFIHRFMFKQSLYIPGIKKDYCAKQFKENRLFHWKHETVARSFRAPWSNYNWTLLQSGSSKLNEQLEMQMNGISEMMRYIQFCKME